MNSHDMLHKRAVYDFQQSLRPCKWTGNGNVSMYVCRECGAAVINDPEADYEAPVVHAKWHLLIARIAHALGVED